jgi:hypothetical protein
MPAMQSMSPALSDSFACGSRDSSGDPAPEVMAVCTSTSVSTAAPAAAAADVGWEDALIIFVVEAVETKADVDASVAVDLALTVAAAASVVVVLTFAGGSTVVAGGGGECAPAVGWAQSGHPEASDRTSLVGMPDGGRSCG